MPSRATKTLKPEKAADMKKPCHFDHLIDEYLLDKLKPEDQAAFEEHYFICPHCFAKLDQQSEIVQILKKEGILETAGVEGCLHTHKPASRWRRLLAKLRRR
jgi:anti-sigma factor RsiW